MTHNNRLTFCTVLACLALPVFGDVLYTDTTFATASYPEAFTPYVHNITGTTTVATGPAQDVGAGNTGNALETIFDASGTGNLNTVIYLGVINSAFAYNPGTQGALQFVSSSIEADQINSNGGFPSDPYYDILIEQGGNYYYDADGPVDPSSPGYQHLTVTDLVASNFWQFNPSTGVTTSTSNLNFSGAAMEFGLIMLSGDLGAPANNQTYLYSNLSLDLTPTPEPAGLLLMGTALGGLAMLRRRKILPAGHSSAR